MAGKFPIPVVPAGSEGSDSSCEGAESFALMVLGDSMLPEFEERDIVIIEPGGLVKHGSFVLAFVDEEWTMRQLVRDGEGWVLQALNPFYPSQPIASLDCIRGVIIQKAKPGRRKASKSYVD
ncbi:MAG: S24 family peptidase [Rhodocyclaceae bacterium]|nr:S24 family peptidase [Rhodocyclaceae bacterium]